MFRISVVFLCLLTLCVPASAAVIIEVQNASITAGGTGFVDVLISSTASEDLYSVGYEFEITGDVLNGSLEFRPSFDFMDPGNETNQTNTEQSVSGPIPYVFFPDTSVDNFFANNLDPLGKQLIGGDTRSIDENISLTSTQQLLARLEVHHITSTPEAAINKTFKIMLKNSGQTSFGSVANQGTLGDLSDDIVTPLGIDGDSFTSFGTITITSAAVPEPSTFAIMGLIAAGLFGKKLRRRKVGEVENSSSSELVS